MPKSDLIIQAPREGTAQSPHTGFSEVRNLDVISNPGVAIMNNILAKVSASTITGLPQWFVADPTTPTSIWTVDNAGAVYKGTSSGGSWAAVTGNTHTFTVTIASPAVFSATAHGFTTNDRVVFSTTGALPTGLSASTIYWIIATGLTADAFQVSTSKGGSAVNTSGSQSGTHSFLTNGGGLAIWKDYLFAPRASSIDVYGPLSNSPSWTNNWKKIDTDSLWHPCLVSKNDGKLYIGADRFVVSLDEATAPFVPATAASYTFTQQALDLPPNYRVKCLSELGNNLMIGTWQGTNYFDVRIGDIFPWDRSAVSFGQPIELAEYGIHGLLNIGNSLAVLAGINGTIYRCDGSNAYIIGQVPNSVTSLVGSNKNLIFHPGAISYYKGRLFFGLSGEGTDAIAGMGVYSLLQTGKGNILTLEHIISTENDGTSNVLKIGALLSVSRDILLVGWRDNTTYGVDKTTNTSFSYTTSYTKVYFDSPLYLVCTVFNPRSFTELELQLSKKLVTGEGIQVKYRNNLSDTFTAIKTPNGGTLSLDFTTLGAVISHRTIADIPSCEFLQMRVEMLGSSTTTPQFRSLTLR